jgi:DNA-binding response OmpR family regulator
MPTTLTAIRPQTALGTVLVADDDPLTRSSTAELLRAAGYECREAADAATATAALAAGECDLLVADIQMPGNSQLELVRELAQSTFLPPVILATGHPSVETAAMAVRCNVLGYLVKPLEATELLRLVRQGVDAAQTMRHLRKRRGKIEQLLGEMRRLEETGQSILRSGGQEALSTYLSLSMEHILTSITDLRNLIEAIIHREDASRASERLADSRPFILLNAVREAIHVLEHTKGAFKSRELADLRRKLEALLTADRPAPARPPNGGGGH